MASTILAAARKLLGGTDPRADLAAARDRLAAEVASLDAKRAELAAVIETAESTVDRETIREANEALARAQAAADREGRRLDGAREANRARLMAEGRARLDTLLAEEDALRARFEVIAAAFVDMERQGRALWGEVETAVRVDLPRLARGIEATRAELAALGATDLPGTGPAMGEIQLLVSVSRGVKEVAAAAPLRLAARSVLESVFSRARF